MWVSLLRDVAVRRARTTKYLRTGKVSIAKSMVGHASELEISVYARLAVLPHGNYLVNLANPDADKWKKSYDCFLDELKVSFFTY